METQTLLMPKKKEKVDLSRKYSLPEGVFNDDFLKQLHTEEDVERFTNDLHAQLYERLLQGEMDVHLGYKKNDPAGNNSGNSRNGSYPKTIQTIHGEHEIEVTAFGSRFNGFGTLHNANPNYKWYGPDAFRTTGDDWTDNYLVRPSYITSPIELMEDME